MAERGQNSASNIEPGWSKKEKKKRKRKRGGGAERHQKRCWRNSNTQGRDQHSFVDRKLITAARKEHKEDKDLTAGGNILKYLAAV